MSDIKAEFTIFEQKTNWASGKVGNYLFEAKLFDEGSKYGIKNGRVSKLTIWDPAVHKKERNLLKACVVNYDRGWDIKPKKRVKPFFNATMELLENAPKRFS